MVGEGGENKWGSNVNYFLEEYGIWINSDAVVRSSYLKYMHPKVSIFSLLVLQKSYLQYDLGSVDIKWGG